MMIKIEGKKYVHIISTSRLICIILLFMMLVVGITIGICSNSTFMNSRYKFDKAIIDTGIEVITVNIEKCKDCGYGEYQIVAEDGNVYLVHISNCTIIKSKE